MCTYKYTKPHIQMEDKLDLTLHSKRKVYNNASFGLLSKFNESFIGGAI